MNKKSEPKTVELVRSDYQPTKAEQEEEFQVDASMEKICRRCVESGQRSMD